MLLLVGGVTQPAAAQISPTATPLPAVIATRQAADNAAQRVNSLQAERAQTQARLDEINRNIEAQIVEAERAAADARTAAATQNAVEAGAAIGRLEGAVSQLRAIYAGKDADKDAIIDDMAARIDQQAAQHITDTRTIDGLMLEVQQANLSKQNAINAYNALDATRQAQSDNDMASNAVLLIVALAVILAALTVVAFVIQRRPVKPAAPDAPADIIDGGYTINDEDETP